MTKAQRALEMAVNGSLTDGKIDPEIARALRVIAYEIDEGYKLLHAKIEANGEATTKRLDRIEGKFSTVGRNVFIILAGGGMTIGTTAIIAALRLS